MPDLAALMGPLTVKMGQLLGQQPAAAGPMGDPLAPSPDPYDDHDAIRERVKKFRDDWGRRELREPFLRAAYRNILFGRGIQWITWTAGGFGGRWRLAAVPRGVPMPVTNRFASTMSALISVFARIEPRLTFRPGAPDEAADRAAADVASRAIETIEDEVNLRIIRQFLAAWVGYTGGSYIETGYDPDPVHGMRTMQLDQCPQCPATQPPGAPMCEACGAVGPLTPISQQVPRGKMYTDVVPLFELYFDPSITDHKKRRKLLREKALSVEDAKERWPDFADQINPNVAGTADEHYMTQLATQGPALDTRSTGRRDQTTSALMNNRVTERWYWQLPDATYPEGLLAIVVGTNTLVYAKPLPYYAADENGNRRYFLPFAWFPQMLIPGTAWPKTIADDLALKQSQRNRWESALELCGMRMGMPVWLKPSQANVRGLTQGGGEAGTVLEYNALGPGNAKPERIPGQPLPMSFLEFIAQIDRDFEELAGTFEIIKGARPEGVSAGIALQILQERGMTRYSPQFILWEAGWAEWAGHAIEIFRQYATEERLLRIKGRDGRWQVEKFIGADLQGRVDVIAEAGSSTPRSTLADRAEIEQLMAYRVLNPQDPETQGKILELYGKTTWLPSMTLDTKNAIMEQEAFQQIAEWPGWQQASDADVQSIQTLPDYLTALVMIKQWGAMYGAPPFPWPEVSAALDGHAVHSREHKNFGKSEAYRAFPKLVQAMYEKKVAYHDQLLIQQMAAVQGGQPIRGGYMEPPPAMTQAQNTSSSPARMAGDNREMERDVAAGGI